MQVLLVRQKNLNRRSDCII